MGCWDDYTYNYKISSFDADQNRELTLSSLLRIQQEAGEQHLNTGGLGYGFLYDLGIVFVLTRASAVIHRLPRFGEDEVGCTTWSNGFSGMLFTRSYALRSSGGELLAESASTFTAINPHTFKLMRPGQVAEMDLPHFPEHISGRAPEKLRFSDEPFAPALNREISYSMIDYNGHLNNTKYADIIYDAYPGELQNRLIKSFDINFLGQALRGDVLEVECAEQAKEEAAESCHIFKGSHSRGNCFTARLYTAPRI